MSGFITLTKSPGGQIEIPVEHIDYIEHDYNSHEDRTYSFVYTKYSRCNVLESPAEILALLTAGEQEPAVRPIPKEELDARCYKFISSIEADTLREAAKELIESTQHAEPEFFHEDHWGSTRDRMVARKATKLKSLLEASK